MNREYATEATYPATRYEGDKQQAPNVRFEVAPGCFVTVFDDGRVRFRIDPQDGRSAVYWRNESNVPGARILETRFK